MSVKKITSKGPAGSDSPRRRDSQIELGACDAMLDQSATVKRAHLWAEAGEQVARQQTRRTRLSARIRCSKAVQIRGIIRAEAAEESRVADDMGSVQAPLARSCSRRSSRSAGRRRGRRNGALGLVGVMVMELK